MTAPRAILFDLDDTLYRERRFVLGGYRAVACAVQRQFGIGRQSAFRHLVDALRRGRRSTAFQDLCDRYGLPHARIPDWVETYRAHQPVMRLPRGARQMLEELRAGWRIGVVTNGLPSIQLAKVAALGLRPLVDAIVYAEEFQGGKPDRAPFVEALARLRVGPSRAVFVGNDPVRDIEGARSAGMATVLLCHACAKSGDPSAITVRPDAVVASLAEVPSAASRLLSERESRTAPPWAEQRAPTGAVRSGVYVS